jgi:hypothetical protein
MIRDLDGYQGTALLEYGYDDIECYVVVYNSSEHKIQIMQM